MKTSLNGKVSIVTGAARGIGAATALRLAENGSDIALIDLNEKEATILAAKITEMGRRTMVLSVDVSDHRKAQQAVQEVSMRLGRIDILVNNAGITRDSLLVKLTEEHWDEVIRVNLKGPFNLGQACAKVMMNQKSGRIINISSVAWQGNIGQTNYSASKAGVVGLTYTWALELSRYGILVNAVAPGFIDSALTQQVPAEIKDKFVQKIPLKRMGQPEEIADVVYFLAQDSTSYLTGQVIHVDGGLTVGIAN